MIWSEREKTVSLGLEPPCYAPTFACGNHASPAHHEHRQHPTSAADFPGNTLQHRCSLSVDYSVRRKCFSVKNLPVCSSKSASAKNRVVCLCFSAFSALSVDRRSTLYNVALPIVGGLIVAARRAGWVVHFVVILGALLLGGNWRIFENQQWPRFVWGETGVAHGRTCALAS